MPGFTGYDDQILEITTNDKLYSRNGFKFVTSPEIAGQFHSLWREAGMPGAGADPATTPGTAYDDTAGGLFFPDQASDKKRLVSGFFNLTQAGNLLIYDRLVAVSGISLASTGNKTISSAALPRYTDGIGVQAWLEITTATATTAPIVTLNSYTDPDDNTGQTGAAVTFPATATNVNTFVQLPLAAGDVGLKAVSTLNVGTAASAGVCNLVLLKPLCPMIPLPVNIGALVDFVLGFPSEPQIFDGATLAFAVLASGATTHRMDFLFNVAYG